MRPENGKKGTDYDYPHQGNMLVDNITIYDLRRSMRPSVAPSHGRVRLMRGSLKFFD